MQSIKSLSLFFVIFLLVCEVARADHGHREWHPHGSFHRHHSHPGFSFYFGLPLYSRPYYSYPYYPYYPPSIVTVPTEPPVYIERTPPQTVQPQPGYWYYCSNPEGYYPYVRECPSGWRQVDPIPPQ
ncbi:MAG: hypothetical protein PHH11_15275 [Methylomonas sp.]|nr:hypothetical protein [Methylomonas sp.]